MKRTFWAAFAALAFTLICTTGCNGPDKRIRDGLDVIKQAQEMQARNADATWASLITLYREKEMKSINGFYESDVKQADANKPKRVDFPTTEAYAEDLVNYTSERSIFLEKSELIRKRNITKLEAKITEAEDSYEATKKNRESYNRLVAALQEYEDAKIDPKAALPLFNQIIAEFVPVDDKPKTPIKKPKK